MLLTPQDSSLQNEVRYAFMIGNLHAHNIKTPLVYISVGKTSQCCREQSSWIRTQAGPHGVETMRAAAMKQLWGSCSAVYPSWAKQGWRSLPSIADLGFRTRGKSHNYSAFCM